MKFILLKFTICDIIRKIKSREEKNENRRETKELQSNVKYKNF